MIETMSNPVAYKETAARWSRETLLKQDWLSDPAGSSTAHFTPMG